MSKDPNKPSEEKTKKLDEITEADIIRTAIDHVKDNYEIIVDASDCRVMPAQNLQVIMESGGPTSIRLPISKWDVYITPKHLSNRSIELPKVTIEYLFGSLEVTG